MIFRYLFYSIYNGYKSLGENNIPGLYAVGIITLLQWLPVYSFITIPYKLKYIMFKVDIIINVVAVLILLAFNSFTYLTKENNKKVMKSVEGLSKEKLNKVRVVAVIYTIITFASVITILML